MSRKEETKELASQYIGKVSGENLAALTALVILVGAILLGLVILDDDSDLELDVETPEVQEETSNTTDADQGNESMSENKTRVESNETDANTTR